MTSLSSNIRSRGSFFMIMLAFILIFSCSEEVTDKYATFESDQIFSFLGKNPDTYSEFLKVLSTSGVSDLLSAYGTYTLFAPTNEAFKKYYAENETSFEQLTSEDIKEIAYTHIIQKQIESIDFPFGIINTSNMDNRFLYISYTTEDNLPVTYVNETSRILVYDQIVHNGVIHTIDGVLKVSKIQFPEFISTDPRLSLFTEALYATGMSDSLRKMDDLQYEQTEIYSSYEYHKTMMKTPPFHKYGYTALIESDSIFEIYGIRNMEDLKRYAAKIYDEMYPSDRNVTDITDRRNSLNRFVSYHLMDRMEADNEFISAEMEYYFVPNTIIYEYIEMMCPNTLLEIQSGNLINKRRDGSAVRIISANHEAINGIYHEIDKPLVYDEGMERDVLNKRLRIDAITMLPELITNKVRDQYTWYIIPDGYMKNMTVSGGTQVHYKKSKEYRAMYGDEILLGGKYDFTLRLPPIPAGRYEVRIGYSFAYGRGVAQMYFDNKPCGIPVDMNIAGNDPRIGYVPDAETDDNGIENDKMMHNRGYMKGPDNQYVLSRLMVARNYNECLRRVVTMETFDRTEPHTLRFKSVEEREDTGFQVDYVEFVPAGYLDIEGRD